uniref:Chemokine interleukin-8-like domain-containing protein n=1 Tax=Aquila chrysaetos chrysaetos TaxID=223781 RepID=A0A663FCZ7_AQUCH
SAASHLLCFLSEGVHGGNNVLDCCLRTSETPIPWRIVQDYRLQLVQDGCDIPAAVFITAKGKRLCAPLQAPWVVRLQEKLDASFARKVRAIPGAVAHPVPPWAEPNGCRSK